MFIPFWDSQTIAPLSNMKQLTVRPDANHWEMLNVRGKSWTPVGPEGILVPKTVLVWDQNITVTLLQYFHSSIFVGSIMLYRYNIKHIKRHSKLCQGIREGCVPGMAYVRQLQWEQAE